MRAYDSDYLEGAMDVLGEAFDCAVERAGLGLQEFFELFVSTGAAAQFGVGNPRYVAGFSGAELVLEVAAAAGLDVGIAVLDGVATGESVEYWTGWILAYYQWATGRPFANIARFATADDIAALYHPLHEAPEDKIVRVMESRALARPTELAAVRAARGLSQSQLAARAGVGLRAIQQYEQRAKDINRASVTTLYALAHTLGCTIEDLLEFPLGS